MNKIKKQWKNFTLAVYFFFLKRIWLRKTINAILQPTIFRIATCGEEKKFDVLTLIGKATTGKTTIQTVGDTGLSVGYRAARSVLYVSFPERFVIKLRITGKHEHPGFIEKEPVAHHPV